MTRSIFCLQIFPEHCVSGDVLQTHSLLEVGYEKQHVGQVGLFARELTPVPHFKTKMVKLILGRERPGCKCVSG